MPGKKKHFVNKSYQENVQCCKMKKKFLHPMNQEQNKTKTCLTLMFKEPEITKKKLLSINVN